MAPRLKVCVCGGGNVAHALAASIGANPDAAVTILTRQPQLWGAQIHAVHGDVVVVGQPKTVTADPAEAVADADLILVAAPAFAHAAILAAIARFVSPRVWVGALPAPGFFDWAASSILPPGTRIFGAQRSPYNCRIAVEGHQVEVLGVVPRLAVAASPRRQFPQLAALLSEALLMPIDELDNFICVTAAPSPAIFHPARLFSLLRGWDGRRGFATAPSFYEDWDDEASRLYLKCDGELQAVCQTLPLDMSGVVPARAYYGASTPVALTARIRGLQGLRGVPAPMRRVGDRYFPDLHSRFFQEDFAFGIRAIRLIAGLAKIETPVLDTIDAWSQSPPIAVPSHPAPAGCVERVRGRSLDDIIRRAMT